MMPCTRDKEIAVIADNQVRTVVSKDSDFLIGHLLEDSPKSLLIVATGNIANTALLALFEKHLDEIVCLLGDSAVVELGRDQLVAHADREPGL